MKKNILKIIVICIFILITWSVYSNGFVKDDYKSKSICARGYSDVEASSERVLKDLKETGYKGNTLTKEMKLYTKITIIDTKKKKYKIVFGDTARETYEDYRDYIYKATPNTVYFEKDDLEKLFGLDENVKEDELSIGYSWNANVIVEGPDERRKVRY